MDLGGVIGPYTTELHMGPPSVCGECRRKLKVFSKRRKCVHCRIMLCKLCFTPHMTDRHGSSSADSDDRDVHFESPMHATALGSPDYEELMLDDVDGVVEVASDDEDDDEDEDDIDDEAENFRAHATRADEEPLPLSSVATAVDLLHDVEEDEEDDEDEEALQFRTRRSHRDSVDEELNQYDEFVRFQSAIATWTRKELNVKRQQKLAKQSHSLCLLPNVVETTRACQAREMFTLLYCAAVTISVWGAYLVIAMVFLQLRRVSFGSAGSMVAFQ